MATTLRDFMAQREGEIREQMKALKAELKELQVAKAALGSEATPAVPKGGTPTIKEMARLVLNTEAAKNGMTSQEILVAIQIEFGKEIDRTSLSPQLSRLKADDEVVLSGEKWFSKERYTAFVNNMFSEFDEFAASPAQPDQQEEDDSDIPF